MSDLTTHAVRIRTVPTPAPRADAISGTVRRVSDLGVGLSAIAARAAGDALDRYWPGASETTAGAISGRWLRAATGMALVTERRALRAGAIIEELAQRSVDTARSVPVVRDVLAGVDASLDRWADRGAAEMHRRERTVTDFATALVPAIVDELLARIDLAAVLDRLPLAEMVGALDVDALLDQIDLDAILARVDLNALLTRVDIAEILRQVDVDEIVRRVDIDGLMDRVDLDALLGRIELGPLVGEVLDEVDIGGIVRESTGSITTDAMDSARISAMRLDDFVGRVADRVLLRGGRSRNPVEHPEDG